MGEKVPWIFLAAALLANTLANFAFKKLVLALAGKQLGVGVLLQSWWTWISAVSCVALVAFYLLALTKIKLPVAYAFVTCGSLVLLSLISGIYLNLPLDRVQIAGVVLVICGVSLLAIG